MANTEGKQLTKEDIRKEIKRETKLYIRKRRWSTFAIILVLIAVILLLIFADGEGLLGNGKSLGLGNKATKVVEKMTNKIEEFNEENLNVDSKSKEEVKKSADDDKQLGPEETEEQVIDDTTIIVSEAEIIYMDKIYSNAELLKEELLKKEFTSEDVITLKDDRAIKSTYEDVKELLEEQEDIQFIEE